MKYLLLGILSFLVILSTSGGVLADTGAGVSVELSTTIVGGGGSSYGGYSGGTSGGGAPTILIPPQPAPTGSPQSDSVTSPQAYVSPQPLPPATLPTEVVLPEVTPPANPVRAPEAPSSRTILLWLLVGGLVVFILWYIYHKVKERSEI